MFLRSKGVAIVKEKSVKKLNLSNSSLPLPAMWKQRELALLTWCVPRGNTLTSGGLFMWAYSWLRKALPTLHLRWIISTPLTIVRFLRSIFWFFFPPDIHLKLDFPYVHKFNPAKRIERERGDGCVFEAACKHMYLGHPTDNVQIESLKERNARIQSMATVKPLSVPVKQKQHALSFNSMSRKSPHWTTLLF